MSNSSLVSYKRISPNKTSPRNHKIDTVTIHCYVGAVSAEDAAAWFASTGAACSCNYYIDKDGRIALIVDEADRSWCSSNKDNDHRAVTIECASGRVHPYTVNDKVYASLIKLLVDICQRNAIKQLLWQADKSLIGQVDKQNMTVHRWFAAKECPGEYLYSRHGQIAAEVNAALGVTESPWYRVRKSWDDAASQKNAYHDLEPAKKCADENPGYSVYDEDGKCLYTSVSKGLQAVDFKGLTEAQAAAKILDLAYADYQVSGILPSVTAAQAILESGYLTTDLAQNANNIFGMKCELSNNTWAGSSWDGSSKYTKPTQEQDKNGNTYTVTADFRKYPCIEDSIADHSAYLLGAMNGSALRYAGLTKAADYVEAITIIKNGGYATDVQYISKICSIIERYGLDKYDGTCSSSDNTADILPDTTEPWCRVRKTWADASGQKGAFHDLELAKICADNNPGYSVYDDAGNVVYTAVVQYKVQAGSFKSKANADKLVAQLKAKANADKLVAQLKAKGFDAFAYLGDDGQYKVQAGVFADKANADVLVDKLKAAKFDACIK